MEIWTSSNHLGVGTVSGARQEHAQWLSVTPANIWSSTEILQVLHLGTLQESSCDLDAATRTRSARTRASVSPVMIMGSTKPFMCGRQAPFSARASTPAHCRQRETLVAIHSYCH